ncbi:exonuclease domain-containing protein [Tepidibacter sp. Z1-5]|uniref:exonuclease domain-containing protein n=1 Tax=Tepidibacter sp. Z1-5 TaxID=3134138 RepID=UPI0030C50DEA
MNKGYALDLEMWCTKTKDDRDDPDIVSVGLVDLEGESEYYTLVRPFKKKKEVPTFMKELLNLPEEEMWNAPMFPKIYYELIGEGALIGDLYTWGNYDDKALRHCCRKHGTPYMFKVKDFQQHIATLTNIRRNLALSDLLELFSLKEEGTKHNALDDAKSLKKLILYFNANEKECVHAIRKKCYETELAQLQERYKDVVDNIK